MHFILGNFYTHEVDFKVKKKIIFFRCLFIYFIIYLAAPGLRCGTLDLRCHVLDLHCGIQDLFSFFFSCYMQTLSCSMRDLVPWLGIKTGPPVLGAWSLSHWTTREVLKKIFNESNLNS